MIVRAPVSIDCTHCGLPVPAGLIQAQQEQQFCCSGCQCAYQLIHACKLDSFYQMVDSDPESRSFRDRGGADEEFSEYKSAVFLDKFATANPGGQYQIKLAIEGMHCAACIWLIEKLPTLCPGVINAEVNWSRATVQIQWQAEKTDLQKIAQTLQRLGYAPIPIREGEKAARFARENRRQLSQLGVAGALAGNNMVISAALYFGMFSHMTVDMIQLMRVSSCFVGILSLLFPGRVFLKSAWAAIRTKTAHMDLPIALALVIGTLAGTINVVRGAGEIYFDSLAVLIFLLLIGRWLQFRQQHRAADAVEMLYRMTPQRARKIVDDQAVDVLVDSLKIDDWVEVRSGEVVPVDGMIISGYSELDESILTGESKAVEKSLGHEVYAGTLNRSAKFVMVACAIGPQTRLSKIAELVESSGQGRPKIVQWADKIGGLFVITVTVLSMLTLAYWWGAGIGFEAAIERAIALLIVACPCALALATPLAIAVALGTAAKANLMVKDGDVLQALQRPGMMWLDKTGTLTLGNLQVERLYGDQRCLPLVAELERCSKHRVAQALVEFAERFDDVDHPAVDYWDHLGRSQFDSQFQGLTNVQEKLGQGISGQLRGHKIVVGTQEFMQANSINVTFRMQRLAKRLAEKGFSPCWIAVDGKISAIAAIGDSLRPEADLAIQNLRARGWETGILSGDHQTIVDRIAQRLNIPLANAIGNVSPEEKLKQVQTSRAQQTTVMVGDGVNDSAALAAASVGIAVKGGAEASLAAAPVYLAKSGLVPILNLFAVSDSAQRTMRRNLFVSLAYNISFAAFAFAGFISPLVAAVLMPISSLTVVSLSLNAGQTQMNK